VSRRPRSRVGYNGLVNRCLGPWIWNLADPSVFTRRLCQRHANLLARRVTPAMPIQRSCKPFSLSVAFLHWPRISYNGAENRCRLLSSGPSTAKAAKQGTVSASRTGREKQASIELGSWLLPDFSKPKQRCGPPLAAI
jgi:hypothetical protein